MTLTAFNNGRRICRCLSTLPSMLFWGYTRKRIPLMSPTKSTVMIQKLSNKESTLLITLHWRITWTRLLKNTNNTHAFLQRNVSRCPCENEAQCYTSLVQPVVEYAATAWDPYTARNIQQLEAVQRRAARFVTGDYKQYMYQPDDYQSRMELSSTGENWYQASDHESHYPWFVDIPAAQFLHPTTAVHSKP